ncbi:MAG: ketopantoate reductase family protein [Halobacteriota archaeon]|nr:ketopantoate reductase family protein [Halobacteriota archaeon]
MISNPTIMVMGAGAVGSLFGGLLADSGYDVTLVGRSAHVDVICKNGLKISGITKKNIRVKASTDPIYADLVLLTTKSYDTEEATRQIPIDVDTTVVSLQNGLGNLEAISGITGEEKVVGGITFLGSTFIEAGHIKHTGLGRIVIGELDGSITDRTKTISKIFQNAGIPVEVTDDIFSRIWDKLIINVGINAPAALAKIKNGQILEYPEMKWVMVEAIKEAISIAEKIGINISEGLIEETIEVAEKTAQNKCSMLQDFERGRKTEIDAINGAIVRLGGRVGVKTPINRVLYSLVKGIESNYD